MSLSRVSRVFVALLSLLALPLSRAGAGEPADIRGLIEAGRWEEAQRTIRLRLQQPDLSFEAREPLLFELERMRRIRLDFTKTREQVLAEARKLVPALDEASFDGWDKAGAVESLRIDGQTWYFNRAAGNLFRIHPEARALKAKQQPVKDPTPPLRLENIRRILAHVDRTGEILNTPKTFRVTYKLTAKPRAVPAGETLRAWLPFPQAGGRQTFVRWLTNDPALHVVSPRTSALSSLYCEKPALAGQPTTFLLAYEYTSRGFHQPIDPARVRPGNGSDPALAPFLAERPPHLAFTSDVRELSREIVGGETNPYLKARRLFEWVDRHIPWAGAREYSTLECLPAYALRRRHGDCGIQTMLFMVLCRLNGIPARWESGWTTGPDRNMHDWCAIYLEPYGWVPVDVSYGLVRSDNERERWFYLGGMDSHRLVVNTDYDQPLFPAKTHPRSELVDFQRGEVEWRGGNLYFDQWSYDYTEREVDAPAAGQ